MPETETLSDYETERRAAYAEKLPEPGEIWIWMPDNEVACELLTIHDVVANGNQRGPFVQAEGNVYPGSRWMTWTALQTYARPARYGEVSP